MTEPGGRGFGQPGQRETTITSVSTQHTLIVKQVRTMAAWGVAIVLILMLGAGLVWLQFWPRGLRRFLASPWWVFALGPPTAPLLAALALGIWRFASEVVDPSAPTPRAPVPPDLQRDGPRWPWSLPIEYLDDEEEDELEPSMLYTVKGEQPITKGATIYVQFEIDHAWEWHRYCAALTLSDKSLRPGFSVRGARKYKLPEVAFGRICKEFLHRDLAFKTHPKRRNSRVELRAVGRAMCKAFARTPPPGE